MNVQVGDWVRIIGTAKTGPVTSVNVGPVRDREGPEGSVVVEDPGTDFFWVVPIEHVEIIESPAVTFSPTVFREWVLDRDLIPDPVSADDRGDFDPSVLAEDLLNVLGRGEHPWIWRHSPDVASVDIWRTADGDGADLGGLPVVELASGVTLAALHLDSDDLVGFPDDGEVGGLDVAVMVLEAVARAANDALAHYRMATWPPE